MVPHRSHERTGGCPDTKNLGRRLQRLPRHSTHPDVPEVRHVQNTVPANTAPVPWLPRRLPGTATSSGVLLGHVSQHVTIARRWAARAAHYQSLAHAVAAAASELVTNAQRHTRSGDPGGTVRVEIERGPHLILRVTDNGPRLDSPPTVPHVPELDPLTPGGHGLRLVQSEAASWDWHQTGAGTMVRAIFGALKEPRGAEDRPDQPPHRRLGSVPREFPGIGQGGVSGTHPDDA